MVNGHDSDNGHGQGAPGTMLSPSAMPQAEPRQGAVTPPPEWSAKANGTVVATQSLTSVARSSGSAAEAMRARMQPIPTGFTALDHWIGNGLRQGELLLLGGAPGVGKTTFCLQMARNIAAGGHANVLYACYEHPAEYVLQRLLVQESIDPAAAGKLAGISLEELLILSMNHAERGAEGGVAAAVHAHPAGAKAATALAGYSARFHLVADAARQSSLAALRSLIATYRQHSESALVLFVDYLQKVEPEGYHHADEAERVTEVVQGLKQLALEFNVAIVAIAAAEKMGITSPRLRFSHLRGSSALMYEADIALIMNDKWQIIDRDHIVFNQHKAQQYRDWVVCTVEKTRSGRNLVEVEFMKRFEYCCFNPVGGRVTERLYEERIQGES